MKVPVNNNNNDSHKPKPKSSKRESAVRLIVITGAAVLALTALALLNNVDFDSLYEKLFAPQPVASDHRPIEFAPADYDENIFENADYLAQNRYIRYTDGALSTLITDGNYAVYSDAVVLLHDYIEAVIRGDAAALPGFFTDDYKKNNALPEKFTMQKLHDVEIEFYSENVLNEGEADQITRWEYIVRYNIMENNGTFRNDVGSDAAVPEIYEVLSYDNEGVILINSITKITWVVG